VRVGLLADSATKCLRPAVSFWVISTPGIKALLAHFVPGTAQHTPHR
jgi:hypothetical protein